MTDASRPHIQRLVGVYNADSTLRGELAYFVGARLGRTHCALCDITHGAIRERTDWQLCRANLPVPFDTYHRYDQPADVRDVVGPDLPAVVADTDLGLYRLLGPEDLAACKASPELLADALIRVADQHHLDWS